MTKCLRFDFDDIRYNRLGYIIGCFEACYSSCSEFQYTTATDCTGFVIRRGNLKQILDTCWQIRQCFEEHIKHIYHTKIRTNMIKIKVKILNKIK